jgi:DNA-binding transcriptional MerR regulator
MPPEGTPDIPDKLYFRIGEVAQIAGVEPYVLRFWETEFPQLAPKKSGTGHRLFRRKEVELVLELKRLLYEKRFTIEGARLYLDQNRKKASARPIQPQPSLFGGPPEALAEIRKELAAILELLKPVE